MLRADDFTHQNCAGRPFAAKPRPCTTRKTTSCSYELAKPITLFLFAKQIICKTRMSYLQSDPRAALAASAKNSAPAATEFAAAEYGLYYEREPQETDPNGRTWYTRAQNFLVAYSKGEAGAVFGRKGQPDEYVVLIPVHGTPIQITAARDSRRIFARYHAPWRQHHHDAKGWRNRPLVY
jgi:hypothetical protein